MTAESLSLIGIRQGRRKADSMEKDIIRSRCRYIVPFYFENGPAESEKILRAGGEDLAWVRTELTDEEDIYTYVKEAFSPGDSGNRPSGIGTVYGLKRKDRPHTIRLGYTFDEKRKRDRIPSGTEAGGLPMKNLLMDNIELCLFSSRVGLFCYELTAALDDTDELIRFENSVKELNFASNAVQLYICRAYADHVSAGALPSDSEEEARLYFADRHPDWDIPGGRVFSTEGKGGSKGWKFEWTVTEPFFLGHFISMFLAGTAGGIRFFSERKSILDEKVMVPDKALLFHYVWLDRTLCGSTEAERNARLERTAYYLNNGFKYSYEMEHNIGERMLRPFANVLFYTTELGSGYFCMSERDNKFFENMSVKVMKAYFPIYLLLLNQMFSVIRFNIDVQNILPAHSEEYMLSGSSSADSKTAEEKERELSGLVAEIDLFVSFNIWGKISSIPQHNEYYSYSYDSLRVGADVRNLQWGLEQLQQMYHGTVMQIAAEKEKRETEEKAAKEKRENEEKAAREKREDEEKDAREKKMEWALGLLSFLTLFSALVDSYQFITGSFEWFPAPYWLRQVIAGLAVVLCIVVAIIAFRGLLKGQNNGKKKEANTDKK